MLSVRLLGAAMLVLSAVMAARSYRADVAAQKQRVQRWCHMLEQMRDGIRSSGAPLPELLRRVLNEQHMPCPEIEDGKSGSWQRALSYLCRQMADDLPGGAAERLLAMPTRFSETDETQPLLAQLDAAIGDMHARRQELEQQLAQRCRVVSTLCVCGALALVLTLW